MAMQELSINEVHEVSGAGGRVAMDGSAGIVGGYAEYGALSYNSLVMNGQLIPYANGVLGEAAAAQAILNAVNTSQLTGTVFNLGYSTGELEMVAGGMLLPVAQ